MNTKDTIRNVMTETIKKVLPKAAVFFVTTYGFPLELFKEEFSKKCTSLGEQYYWCNNFQKDNPRLFS